jgi:hypothetical protein
MTKSENNPKSAGRSFQRRDAKGAEGRGAAKLHPKRFGLRWQSEAAPPLSGCRQDCQSGVALRFPPQSKSLWLRLSLSASLCVLCVSALNPNSEVESGRWQGARPSGRFKARLARDFRTHKNLRRVKRHKCRAPAPCDCLHAFPASEFGLKGAPFGLRTSGFGLLSDFVIRTSDFPPHVPPP